MKNYKAILFDMDGTLVPMDIDAFTNGYFKILCKKLAHHNIPNETIVKCIWAGTKAMVMNDGNKTNEEVFWSKFETLIPGARKLLEEECKDFYGNEFQQAIVFTSPNPLAKEAVELVKAKGKTVVLATNPLFPMPGQVTRMHYVGLEPNDFAYVSSFECERFCKPNPLYYKDVLEKNNLKPEECLMVGNDEYEDAWSASQVGMDCYLITDCLIPSDKYHHEGNRGTFKEFFEYLKTL